MPTTNVKPNYIINTHTHNKMKTKTKIKTIKRLKNKAVYDILKEK